MPALPTGEIAAWLQLDWATELTHIALDRALTIQSRNDLQDAVDQEDPAAIDSAIRYWGSKDAIVSAVFTDAQRKVRHKDRRVRMLRISRDSLHMPFSACLAE